MAGNSNSGGPRRGAGPPRRNLSLSKGDARTLHILLKHQRGLRNNPGLSAEALIGEWIEREWRELDQMHQEAAQEAHEPYILS